MDSVKEPRADAGGRSTTGRRLCLAMRLASGDAARIDDLAAEFGCSRRTVFRDMHILRTELGMQTHTDPVTRRLHAKLPAEYSPTSHDDCLANPSQRLAAAFALELADGGPLGVLEVPSKLALQSLRASLDDASLERLNTMLSLFRVGRNDRAPVGRQVQRQLLDLVRNSSERPLVEVTHRVGDRRVDTQLRLESVEADYEGEWIVVGYSMLAESVINLAVSKIESIRSVATEAGLSNGLAPPPHFATREEEQADGDGCHAVQSNQSRSLA